MGHVVIAPDKFKGSLTAAEVAARVAAGLRAAVPGIGCVELPVADGGDGTVDAAVAAGFERVDVEVTGPAAGQRVTASFARSGATAVIEAAQACGLALLLSGGELAPLTATSRGVGELILAAVNAGARRVVLGLGGVAANDGGAGLARALGARLLDDTGRELPPGGGSLAQLAKIVLPDPAVLEGVEFLVASDVDNPLLGPHGAAAVYGPQKGASPADVTVLDAALARWADVTEDALGTRMRDEPGAGAAGGLGFASLLFLRARLRPGIELLLDMLGFARHLDGADLVITGEGSLDEQTLRGKAPAGVARAAAAHRPPVPAVAVCGVCSLTPEAWKKAGISMVSSLSYIEPDAARSIANAGPLTERLAADLAAVWFGT